MPGPDTTWATHVFTAPDLRDGHYAKSRYPQANSPSRTPRADVVSNRLDFNATPTTLPMTSPRRPKPSTASPPDFYAFGNYYGTRRGHKFLCRPNDPLKLTPLAPKLRGAGGQPGSDEEYYAHLSFQLDNGRQVPSRQLRAGTIRTSPDHLASPRHLIVSPRLARPLWNKSEREPGLWPHQNSWGLQAPPVVCAEPPPE